MCDGSTSRRSKERTITPTGRGAQASRKSRTGKARTRTPAHKGELVYEAEKLRLEAQLDIPNEGKGDPQDIESRLRDFGDAEDETVYCDIKPKISENVEDPLPRQKVKLPSPIKSSALCKKTPQIDQAYCDAEERLHVSWIKELSAKQSRTKGETNLQSIPAFSKSIPR